MKNNRTNQIARGLLPYLTMILSMSLAVTLRVERSCSDVGPTYRAPSSGPSFDVQDGTNLPTAH